MFSADTLDIIQQVQVAHALRPVRMVHRLGQLALDENTPPETARKAATTLLTVDLSQPL
jgi:hypothetical protein